MGIRRPSVKRAERLWQLMSKALPAEPEPPPEPLRTYMDELVRLPRRPGSWGELLKQAAKPGPARTHIDPSLILKKEVEKVDLPPNSAILRAMRSHMSVQQLAAQYGISEQRLRDEVCGQTWGAAEDEELRAWLNLPEPEKTPVEQPPAEAQSPERLATTTDGHEPTPELPAYPELTPEALEAAIRAGKREYEMAEMFGCHMSTIKHRKVEWGLIGLSPNRRGGRRIGSPGRLKPRASLPAAAEQRPEPAAPPDRFAITVRRASIPIGEAGSMLSGLADYLKVSTGVVSIKFEVEEVPS